VFRQKKVTLQRNFTNYYGEIKYLMKKNTLLVFTFILLFVCSVNAGIFEGNILFVKQTQHDTVFYSFSVRNNLVRVDERNSRQQIVQSVIINIVSSEVTALSPSMKLYTTLHPQAESIAHSGNVEVTKTQRYKIIDGYKCSQWRLRNKQMNSEITYWVYESEMSFFNKIITLLSRTPEYVRFCNLFDYIPESDGFMPMLTVERSLLRDEKTRVVLQKIDRRKLDHKLFIIPRDYKYLRS
jgi:hypothetical protein